MKKKLTLNEMMEARDNYVEALMGSNKMKELDDSIKQRKQSLDDNQISRQDTLRRSQEADDTENLPKRTTNSNNDIVSKLEEVLNSIERAYKYIDSSLSSFQSPGMRQAFTNAINKGISSGNRSFNSKVARKVLADHYNNN